MCIAARWGAKVLPPVTRRLWGWGSYHGYSPRFYFSQVSFQFWSYNVYTSLRNNKVTTQNSFPTFKKHLNVFRQGCKGTQSKPSSLKSFTSISLLKWTFSWFQQVVISLTIKALPWLRVLHRPQLPETSSLCLGFLNPSKTNISFSIPFSGIVSAGSEVRPTENCNSLTFTGLLLQSPKHNSFFSGSPSK